MAPIDRTPANLQRALGIRQSRLNDWKQTPDTIARALADQSKERIAVVLPEIRKDPHEALKLLMAVYRDTALDVLILYDKMCDIHGPATMSRHLEDVLQERNGR